MSLENLVDAARVIGEARAEALRGRVVDAVMREVPGARVEVSRREVVITGRGLRPALRWIGCLIR